MDRLPRGPPILRPTTPTTGMRAPRREGDDLSRTFLFHRVRQTSSAANARARKAREQQMRSMPHGRGGSMSQDGSGPEATPTSMQSVNRLRPAHGSTCAIKRDVSREPPASTSVHTQRMSLKWKSLSTLAACVPRPPLRFQAYGNQSAAFCTPSALRLTVGTSTKLLASFHWTSGR